MFFKKSMVGNNIICVPKPRMNAKYTVQELIANSPILCGGIMLYASVAYRHHDTNTQQNGIYLYQSMAEQELQLTIFSLLFEV